MNSQFRPTHLPAVRSRWVLRAALALVTVACPLGRAAERPGPFDAIIGDWQGPTPGIVAQVYSPQGETLQANLLRGFDLPDNLVAVLSGQKSGNQFVFQGNGWTGRIEGGRFTVQKGAHQNVLERVVRRPPTLGAKPPPGGIVLFDGTNMDQWARQKPKQWDQPDGPANCWKLVEGGVVEVVPGSGSIITKKHFGDFRLHVEFRTLGGPVNSGVYLQSRYEVNLSESYGRVDGSPCGTLANLNPPVGPPRVRVAAPPGQWQTLDIEFRAPRFDPQTGEKTKNARVTIAHNGVTTYEDVELTTPKGAAKRLGESPTGPLMLQEHGTPIQFRNIWIVELSR